MGDLEEKAVAEGLGVRLATFLEREGQSLGEFMQVGKVKFVACTSSSPELRDFRRHLVNNQITYFLTHEAVEMALGAIPYSEPKSLEVRPLQSLGSGEPLRG